MIEHVEAGDGVFLKTLDGERQGFIIFELINSLQIGLFLGFVPGVIYDSYKQLND